MRGRDTGTVLDAHIDAISWEGASGSPDGLGSGRKPHRPDLQCAGTTGLISGKLNV